MRAYISCDCDDIEYDAGEAVRDAAERREPTALILQVPITMSIPFKETLYADGVALLAGAERVDGRALQSSFDSVRDAYRTFVVTYYLSRGVEA